MAQIPPDHVMVAVPPGHTVQVHPPGHAQMTPASTPVNAHPTGMVHDPMANGAKLAMDAALAGGVEEAGESPQMEGQEKKSGQERKETVHKKTKPKAGWAPKK